MKARKASRVGAAVAGLAFALAAATLGTSSCQQQPVTVPVRSLERSGRAAFVCLDHPGLAQPAHPLSDCTNQTVAYPTDFADEAGVTIPHIYGLVTQTTRGEVAVVDISAQTSTGVLDEDPSVPGNNFLPIGAQPEDIVATPGGTATFVGVGEIGRQGIFALPSTMIRPGSGVSGQGGGGGRGGFDAGVLTRAPRLTTWPACSLPSRPGSMIIVSDAPDQAGGVRAACPGAPASPPGGMQGRHGDLSAEKQGREKLVVALPDRGGLVVIDAQTVLDRPPGSFDPCPIERFLPLRVELPAPVIPPAPKGGPGCVNPAPVMSAVQPVPTPRPAGLAYANGRLYVADLAAPVIHVVDLPSPCEPAERLPLLPSSLEDPTRVVTTSRLAVTASPTLALKRYLYAIDPVDGSAMVFDVSDAPASRSPLPRLHPEYDPFAPRDRVRLGIPASDVFIVQRDVPLANLVTGVAASGVRCDPDPAHVCVSDQATCDTGVLYRTDTSAYASGARPLSLRGTFAFLLLTSGRLAVVDIDDYDAPCRGPSVPSRLAGCAGDGVSRPLVTSLELSCNVIEPNQPRDSVFELDSSVAGFHAPGVQIVPSLYDVSGSPIPVTDPTAPRMVATLPTSASEAAALSLSVGGTATPYLVSSADATRPNGLAVSPDGTLHDALAMNLEDPRAQVADQAWSVTYEGALPFFSERFARLDLQTDDTGTVSDPSSRFCDYGVLGEGAVRAELPAGTAEADIEARADYLQIASDLPAASDIYWRAAVSPPAAACPGFQASGTGADQLAGAAQALYQACNTAYGTVAAPQVARDLRILEAFEDHLTVERRNAPSDAKAKVPPVGCCFQALVSFNIRVGSQWAVIGQATSFTHHVIVDPATQACRNSCDPAVQRRNGRAVTIPRMTPKPATIVHDGDPGEFINPMFRFAILSGQVPTKDKMTTSGVPTRDTVFRFITSGGFVPLTVNLAADTTTLVSPQAITFVPPTSELAITDAASQGLILVSTDSVQFTRDFF